MSDGMPQHDATAGGEREKWKGAMKSRAKRKRTQVISDLSP
jgi:hypothetical protein